MNRLKTLRLNRCLAAVLTIAALMTGQEAWGDSKTVTYTLSKSGTSTLIATPDKECFDGNNNAITINSSIDGTESSLGFYLYDNISIILNLRDYSGSDRMSVSNNGLTCNFAASLSFACKDYYVTHIALKDDHGNTISVYRPGVSPQTNFGLDVDVDIDKQEASGAPATVQSYFVRTVNTSFTIKTIAITYGTTPRRYNITYTNAVNGQNGVKNTNNTTYDVTSALYIHAPTRTGYTFDGFTYTDAIHTTATDATPLPFTISRGDAATRKDITFVAAWTVNEYTVTLDNQEATTAGSASVTANYDAAMPAITIPTKTGYTFGGYYTETNGGGTQYYHADGTSAHIWDIAQATMLYAKWTANEYTVTLDNQSATTAGSASVTATYDDAMPTITVPTKTGYTFGGYYTETNGSGTKFYNADGTSATAWNIAQATTLYAKWTGNTYTVTLDNQGATTAGSTEATATYGTAMPAITVPTKTCYTFGGYYTEVNGGGTQYYNADGTSAHIWDIAQAITLYAKWTLNPVAYIAADGTTRYCLDYTPVPSSDDDVSLGSSDNAEGWYVVSGDVTITGELSLEDQAVHLILCDGATLTVSSSDYPCISVYYNSKADLTIYGQTLGTGTAHLTATDGFGIYSSGNITITGGIINATTTGNTAIYSQYNVTITGGIINATATGNTAIYSQKNVTITGGSVTATGSNGIRVRNSNGNIYLGWRNASDRIKATDYTCANLVIIAGQSLTDGTDTYSGTLTDAQRSAIAGKTLSPGDNIPVPYIDADGKDASIAADGFTLITSNSGDVSYGNSENTEAWYVVSGSVTIGGRLTLQDQCANIVLCDNATLTVSSGSDAVAVPNGNVNIFVQSNASGTANLTATADGITATGSVALHGGTVTVKGSEHGISATAVTLGCHTTANRITVSSYDGTVTVKSGQTLTDGSSAAYSGTLTDMQVSAIAGKTLYLGIADVSYIDGDGKAQVCPAAIPVESSDKDIYLGGSTNSQGWYVVNRDVTINGSLWLNDQAAYLILCDGATLTVNDDGSRGAIYPNGSLTLYGQSEGTGSVVATNTRTSSGYGIEVPYDLTIHGGNVSATGNSYGIKANNITLGWSNPASSIYASSYSGTVKVKDGQAFTDDTDVYYGTLTDDQRTAIAGKTLVPYGVTVSMNSSGIRTYASPYDLDMSAVDAYVISAQSGEKLTLTPVTEAPANTGLLLKAKDDSQKGTTVVLPLKENAAAVGTNLLKPVLSSETIVPQTDGAYTNFILANGAHGIDWYTLSAPGAIGANKAYLQLLTANLPSTSSRGFTWVIDGGTTGIVNNKRETITNNHWYDLSGRKLSGKPTRKGMYIHNGKTVLVP